MIVDCPSCSRPNRLPAARLGDRARCAACKAHLLPPARPIGVRSGTDFDELTRDSPVPVVVDFWAGWCAPCHAVAPALDQIARDRAGRVIVAKVDTEALPDVAARFGVRNIPTMIVFRRGKEAERVSGAMPAQAIVERLMI
ncbi:MAG TPA: thioredoxin TrxC [Polyangiaceae bacterium]|nr:thioredoxin TrxC [Polyangiaceae bacterium]